MLPISSAGNSQQSLMMMMIWISSTIVFLACSFSVDGQITQAKSPGWNSSKEYTTIKRSDFPSDFVFGASTAAAQIEGSTNYGGKSPSIWDQYIQKFPDKVVDKSNMNIAIDSYKRYEEDVLALKELGVDTYRFSIAWTRILPDGTLKGGINEDGINHYNSFIDELIKHGIKPFVTLLHFDSPEALENKYGGFLNRNIVMDFKDYAEICFRRFGDRVKNWVTINEPLVMAKFGYGMGFSPPGRCSDRISCHAGNSATEPYIVTHNILLAHATAANLYKKVYQATQGGQIGISLVGQHIEPYSTSKLDVSAAKRGMDFELGWFMEPLVFGEYPISMRRLAKDRLPVFTAEEKKLIEGSFDFIGINYYTARYAKHTPIIYNPQALPVSYMVDEHVNFTVDKDGVLIGPNPGGSTILYVYPIGLYKILRFINKHYGQNLTIYITENGFTEKRDETLPISKVLNDQDRIEFIQKHLFQLSKAIRSGVNVKGYIYWSLVDDFEWLEGYTIGYGLYYVSFKSLKRIPKESAKWYHDFIKCDKKCA